MDADLQHPPELLPKLFRAILDGGDLAIGSRYTPGGELGGWNPVSKLLSAAAVWATWPLQREACAPKIPCQASSWFAAPVLTRSPSSVPVSSCCSKFWSAPAFTRSEKSRSPSATASRASKINFKVAWDYALLLIRLYAVKFGFHRRRSLGEGVEG